MTTAAEYREYAHECARWAAEAKSDEMRDAFLDMANHWLRPPSRSMVSSLHRLRARRRVPAFWKTAPGGAQPKVRF
jgi:hypothetical protein